MIPPQYLEKHIKEHGSKLSEEKWIKDSGGKGETLVTSTSSSLRKSFDVKGYRFGNFVSFQDWRDSDSVGGCIDASKGTLVLEGICQWCGVVFMGNC
jgi:hypothetical protein